MNQSLYGRFNASMLNESAAVINQAIVEGVVPQPSYLFATLLAANASVPDSNPGSGNNAANTGESGNSNTDLAM